MMNFTASNPAQWIAQQVRSQPLRAGLLCVLLTAMGVMWARHFSGSDPGPAAASARAAMPPAQAAPALSPSAAALRAFLQESPGAIRRNLFAIDYDHFPRADADLQAPRRPGEGFWDQIAKSLAARADQERARRIFVDNVKAQAAHLKLRSTIMGQGSPKALVNDVLVGEGDEVAGFRVLKIEARRIVVERDGVKLEVVFNFGQ